MVSGAQTGQAVIDSSAQARSAFRAAALAPTLAETVLLLLRAARAWPTQPAYWEAVARMGARASDTLVVQEALKSLAELHAGGMLSTDTALHRLALTPSIARDLGRVNRAIGTLTNGRAVATLSDTTIFAEGVDADARTGKLYVASIRHRTIFEVAPAGQVRDLHVSAGARIGAILGVRVAADGQTLFATTAGLPTMIGYAASDSLLSAVIQVSITDGHILARWDVPRDGKPHLLGDLAITAQGDVYISDSFAPILFRLRPGADSLESIWHPLFRSLQGIAPVPGHEELIVADYSHGLLRIDLRSRQVTRIADAVGSTSLGVDGIVWHDRGIIAVQNGIAPPRVVYFAMDSTRARIERVVELDRQPTVADEPTIGTIWRGGFVYVANSQWEKYEDSGARRAGTVLRATTLLCVPLPAVSSRQVVDTARNGTRRTTSVPPPLRTCSASDAASP
jgi:sugar lactone lactonase YvrE